MAVGGDWPPRLWGEPDVSWAAMTRPSLPAPNSQPSTDTCTTKRIKHQTLARNRCR
jgi:hypothetical protein